MINQFLVDSNDLLSCATSPRSFSYLLVLQCAIPGQERYNLPFRNNMTSLFKIKSLRTLHSAETPHVNHYWPYLRLIKDDCWRRNRDINASGDSADIHLSTGYVVGLLSRTYIVPKITPCHSYYLLYSTAHAPVSSFRGYIREWVSNKCWRISSQCIYIW
jgi:hypothetical protein